MVITQPGHEGSYGIHIDKLGEFNESIIGIMIEKL